MTPSDWIGLAGLPLGVAGLVVAFRSLRLTPDDVDQERDRLRQVIGDGDSAEVSTQSRDFSKLLIDYYAYGLLQARRSFNVSLGFSLVGGLVLLFGIGLAVTKAETSGQQYASIVASVAGVLTTATGTLFHRRADNALKHMESQTTSLRQDMNAERDGSQAVKILEDVVDGGLKAHLQAALVLRLSGAELPNLGSVIRATEGMPRMPSSESVPGQQHESSAS
ncbi:hypothetical protein AQJ23_00135 [Streptomyces antibioticus]|nr:hypothetical protein [Streptomyces antibioticus]KUN29242.1 hypothetical protein AQJ23_00135 [Streptomyces antibioticus]